MAVLAVVAALLDTSGADADVVIRPLPTTSDGATSGPLTRQGGPSGVAAAKMRLEPTTRRRPLRVHPGHDWFFVLSGTVQLFLGERQILVAAGEAAEFSTTVPHGWVAHDGPAELIMIFDRDGQHAHHGDTP
jgi:quercetin dioxygenase-like cupin family protein